MAPGRRAGGRARPLPQLPAASPERPVGLSRGWAGLRRSSASWYLALAAGALVLASLSLLLPSTPSYDPWAWLGWGREIVHLNLHTTGGPSWKPLPVLFTTLFAPLGSAAPDLWLVVARAGALLAVAMVFRLAFRLTRSLLPAGEEGRTLVRLAPALLAGLVAAAGLLNSHGFILENALAYSEGLTTALILIALDRLIDGSRRQALLLGFLAGLGRPELWVVWVPFGLWLAWRDPGTRRLVVTLFALTPLLWLLPELWGSGQLLRAVTRAHHPNPGAATFTGCPACTVLQDEAWPALMGRLEVPAIAALLAAAALVWRRRRSRRGSSRVPQAAGAWSWLLVLGAAGLLWWLGIALETQAGFAGNSRYLEPGTALVAVAGGIAWGWLAILASRGLRRAMRPLSTATSLAAGALVATAALIATPPWIGRDVIDLPRVGHELRYQAELRSDLSGAIARAGGAGALLRCGPVMTEGYQVPMVAWMLGVPAARIEPPPVRLTAGPAPGVLLQTRAQAASELLPAPSQIRAWEHAGAPYALLAHVRTFSVFSTCPRKVAG